MFNAGLWPDQASNHCAGTRNSQCGPTRCWRGWGCSAVVINALADALALAAWPRRLLLLQKENFVMKRFPNYFAKIKGKNMRNGIQCQRRNSNLAFYDLAKQKNRLLPTKTYPGHCLNCCCSGQLAEIFYKMGNTLTYGKFLLSVF